MLINLSENLTAGKKTITKELGEAFPAETVEKMGGVNSGILEVNSSSIEIFNLLINSPGLKTCQIEIRPDGIVVRFQADMEKYALVIPYYKLRIYKGRAQEYSIYKDSQFMKVKADRQEIHDFFRKIRHLKMEHWSSQKAWD